MPFRAVFPAALAPPYSLEQRTPGDFRHDSALREKRGIVTTLFFSRELPEVCFFAAFFNASWSCTGSRECKSRHNLIKIAENQYLNPDDRWIRIWQRMHRVTSDSGWLLRSR